MRMEKPQYGFVVSVALAVHAAVAAVLASALFIPGFDFAMAFVIFLYTIAWGFVPVVLYGAVAYTLMAQTGYARWHYVLLVGIAPGVAALPFLHGFFGGVGVVAICYGAAVALLTHLICRKRYRAWMRARP